MVVHTYTHSIQKAERQEHHYEKDHYEFKANLYYTKTLSQKRGKFREKSAQLKGLRKALWKSGLNLDLKRD